MTTLDVLAALRRRWDVAIWCLILTSAALAWVFVRPGVYWAQADVVFLSPPTSTFPNPIQNNTQSIIAFAGLTERTVNSGIREPATASSSVSLVGKGIYNGSSVELPNAGGQWAYDFERPVLSVQASGPTEAAVRARMDELVYEIRSTVHNRQLADGTASSGWITIQTFPGSATVGYSKGSPPRAALAVLVLGTLFTLFTTVQLDRHRVIFQRLTRLIAWPRRTQHSP